MRIEGARDGGPDLTQVLFAVLGEESREGGFFGECPAFIIVRGKCVDFPLRVA